MRFVVIKRSWFLFLAFCCVVAFGGWYVVNKGIIPTTGQVKQNEETVIHLITTEFETKTADGKEIEVYRWDPGTVVAPKGKEVTFKLFGLNGHEHHFTIEGTSIHGVVNKGKETVVKVQFDEPGVYKLICTSHANDVVPMIAYIHVY